MVYGLFLASISIVAPFHSTWAPSQQWVKILLCGLGLFGTLIGSFGAYMRGMVTADMLRLKVSE